MLAFIENILKGVKQWAEGLFENRDYVIASHINGIHADFDSAIEEIKEELATKQDTLVAGSNIVITDNTISATDSIEAGTNILRDGDTISAEGYYYDSSYQSFSEGRIKYSGILPRALGYYSHAEGDFSYPFFFTAGKIYNNNAADQTKVTCADQTTYDNVSIGDVLRNRTTGYVAIVTDKYVDEGGIYRLQLHRSAVFNSTDTVARYGGGFAFEQAGHVEGTGNVALCISEHAEGRFNVSHKDLKNHGTISSVGIGERGNRKNAFEVMDNGDAYIYGVGEYDGVHIKGEQNNIQVQTLQEYIANIVSSTDIRNIWKGTQNQYDAIQSPSDTTLYVIIVPLTLTIGSDTIQYDPNMTWQQWVDSNYNTFGWTAGENDNYIYNGMNLLQVDGSNVEKTAAIDGEETYSWVTPVEPEQEEPVE